MLKAITRQVSPAIGDCELTHIERVPIDYELVCAQHHRYEQILVGLGCDLTTLPSASDLPDSVFVEDIAVVLPEVAIISRPGAKSRRPETAVIAEALEPYRRLVFIQPPGTLDGGDVLVLDRKVFVGLSTRSNPAALEQLRNALSVFGYEIIGVKVEGALHLKSAVTRVGPDELLVNPAWVDVSLFPHYRQVEVDPVESFAANGLLVGDALVYPSAFPKTLARLRASGIDTRLVEVSELAKAEGAVTCCSLIFDVEQS